MIKRAEWLAIAKDRAALLLLFILAVTIIVVIVTSLLRIQTSDIQVPVRFTTYGQNNIYRDQWYVQYGYMAFAILVGGINSFLVVRLYQLNRLLSFGFLGLSIFTMVVAMFVMNAVFNLTPVV